MRRSMSAGIADTERDQKPAGAHVPQLGTLPNRLMTAFEVAEFVGCHEETVRRAYLRGLRPADLDRVVDENWDPPVTLGVRLVSVLDDDFQHVGQAAYVRGLILR